MSSTDTGVGPTVGKGAQRGPAKTARIPIKVVAAETLAKPAWIRVRVSQSESFRHVKRVLREASLHTVCEEASCPNIGECFGNGTATFMVLGRLCTRRCPFCDVAHGGPSPPDPLKPQRLADTVARLDLNHVVITSVDRDDLRDGGAGHFAACIRAVRQGAPRTRIEVLTPDFRGRAEVGMLTIGQYLQPRPGNLPVRRYVAPQAFAALAQQARQLGFTHAAGGPLVRSSYHADRQARAAGL